jgi:two-component system CheB/CheR fusion protein
VVGLELRALGADPDGTRVIVEGPEVPLPPRSVQILALGLHELATNARKYGALGAPNGSLSVRWHVTSDEGTRTLRLHWSEDGIASRRTTAPHPERLGLGRTLIEQSIPFQLDAATHLVITADAVRCDISLPIDGVSATRAADGLQ